MTRTRIHVLIAALAILAGLLLTTAVAQNAGDPGQAVVATCDVADIFAHSRQASDLNNELRQRRIALQDEQATRQKAADDVVAEMQNYKPGSEKHDELVDKLDRMQAEYELWGKQEQMRLTRWHTRKTIEMYDAIIAAVAKVAKNRGITVVLYQDHSELVAQDIRAILDQIQQRTLLYAAGNLDITEAVLTQVNADYGAGEAPATR